MHEHRPPYCATTGDDGTTRFTLHAPGKDRVSVVGDFNDWKTDAHPLEPDDDGDWSAKIPLDPGEHRYQYQVDDLRIADPYAQHIVWPGGEHEGAGPPEAILHVGRQPFEWQHDGWDRPPLRDLVLYELAVGDFTPNHRFTEVIERLDYLADLGVNAIELMPVTAPQPQDPWGYAPCYHFAARPDRGTPGELRQLIDACHGHGIAVLLDLVLTHTSADHPLNQLYPADQSPWYGTSITGEQNEFGLPTFDYRKPATARFAADVVRFWLSEFHVDGYRLDYIKLIGRDDDGHGIPHLVQAARAVQPEAYLIAEHIPENPPLVSDTGLSGAWHNRITEAMQALLLRKPIGQYSPERLGEAMETLDPFKQGYRSAFEMVNYLESHDEDRLVRELREAGHDEDEVHHRAALGATVLLTMPGQPLLYSGQEWAEDLCMKDNHRNPIQWDRLDTERGRRLHEHVRRLIRLRREHPALRSDSFYLDRVDEEAKTAVYHRWEDAGDEVWVAVNFADEQRDIEAPLPEGRWRDVLGDRTVESDGEHWPRVDVPGPGAALLVRA